MNFAQGIHLVKFERYRVPSPDASHHLGVPRLFSHVEVETPHGIGFSFLLFLLIFAACLQCMHCVRCLLALTHAQSVNTDTQTEQSKNVSCYLCSSGNALMLHCRAALTAGWLCFIDVSVLFWPIARNSFLNQICGVPYPVLIRFHR